MVIVKTSGYDIYFIEDLSHKWQAKLAEIFHVKEDDISFIAYNSFFIHDSHEQTGFVIDCKFEISEKEEQYMDEAAKFMQRTLTNLSVNSRISYSVYKKEYIYKNEMYPMYMNKHNVVNAIDEEEQLSEEEEEQYTDEEILQMLEEIDLKIKKERSDESAKKAIKLKGNTYDPFSNYRTKSVTEYCEGDDCDCSCDDEECNCHKGFEHEEECHCNNHEHEEHHCCCHNKNK